MTGGNASQQEVSVRDFGARGDGQADDAEAIQKALDSGRGPVGFPDGNYRVGKTLLVPSGTVIRAKPGARIFLTDGAGRDGKSFLLANRNPDAGDADITIEGGVWDGNNPGNPRGPDEPGSYGGILMDFTAVRKLVIRKLVVQDAESYFIRLGEVRGFTVEDITFKAPHPRPNMDGVHLGGFCEDGVIRNLAGVGKAATNDDMVALNADDILWRVQNIGMKCGPIKRIRVENLRAEDCHTFVRILSVESAIEDVTVTGVRGGCAVGVLNMDAARKCKTPMFDDREPRYAAGVGNVRRVTIRDVEAFKTTPGVDNPMVDIQTNVEYLTIANFGRDAARDRYPGAATVGVDLVSSTHVEFEGLTEGQAAELRKASRGLKEDSSHPGAAFLLEHSSSLYLPHGGFSSLHVSSH